jgi:hypothetical protein
VRLTWFRFVFGGYNAQIQSTDTFSDTYVLTIPGFRWFKGADTSASKRAFQACLVAGKRQMISIGGVDMTNGKQWDVIDDRPNGIGVMDLTTMTWSNTFDASAPEYDSPKVVKDWYAQG